MRLIVTVDDAYGVAFNQRRQSRDRILTADMLQSLPSGTTLVVSPYSLPLVPDGAANLRVAEDPVDSLGEQEIAFLERTNIRPLSESLTELTVYRWNRRYPQDVSLGIVPSDVGMHLCERTEFVGSSHDTITKEIYRK